ncbi:ERI1 exoribonuclease 2 isoform X1 [Acipenser ruthenus]|uniref:ERI1 exoribonuclease 2 isoform X1 n=1 Tax=Acipenser ruthenus TaxID=7906 RepID=UPI002741128E|nr:ERI1 exoribonuclease 2 isoform X1 [Acipenser ruthenus]
MATKQLAKTLGLIRRRSGSSSSSTLKRSGAEQFFSYLIVIDFESTCWREKNHYGQEIIEFPAVLLNTTNGQIDSEFQTYVQPQEHPTLSEFCTELTGIKQSQVEAGVPLRICLSQFSRWLQKLQQEKNVVFVTDMSGLCAPSAKPCAFVTWSDWDLGVCLQYECKRKQLRKPPVLNRWIDLRATYKLFYNRMPKGLNGALQDLGIEFCGREHSGLDDARNTAGLAWRMITDGCVMKVTKSLDRAPPKTTPPVRPLALNADVASVSKNSDSRKACSPNRMARSSKQEQAGDRDAVPSASKIKRLESDTLQTTLQAPRQQANTTGCQYRSLVSPKTLLHGLSAPGAWGRLSRPALTPQTHALVSLVSAGNPSTRSLVLVPTTVDSVTNISGLDLNTACDSEILLADWEDGAMLPETEEPSSYDAVTLEQEEGGWGTAMPAGTAGLTADVSNYADAEEFKNDVPPVCLKSQLLNTMVYSGEDAGARPSGGGDAGARPSGGGDVGVRSLGSVAFKAPPAAAAAKSTSGANRARRTPIGSSSFSTARPRPLGGEKSTRSSLYFPKSNPSFTIHADEEASLSSRSTGSSVPPTVLSAVVNWRSVPPSRGGKVTPPLCECGRRAKKLNVSNGGPNQGKGFYCCPVGKQGCGYFKWESVLLKEKARASFSASGSRTSFQSGNLGLRPSLRNECSNRVLKTGL